MSENKTHAQNLAKTFVYLDFTYQYSDDSRAYAAGRDSTNKFREDYSKLTPQEKKEFYAELKESKRFDKLTDEIENFKIEIFED